jgi:hypothetical protein
MNEKPQVVRSSEPRVGAARKAEELLGVTEIVLGHALEGRDRMAELGAAEKAESSPAQAGRTAAVFSLIIAYMQRLAFREDADTADARKAMEEKALAEEAKRKTAEELAAVAVARAVRKVPEGKPNSDAEARERAERAEADLAQERARNQALKQQLSIRQNDQKLLAQERARIQALEKQLAARADEQKLLAQERARTQALEQQLLIRQNDQKLLAQERARTHALEQQLSMHGAGGLRLGVPVLADRLTVRLAAAGHQKLLAQERARTQALEQQLAIRQNDQKLRAPAAWPAKAALPLEQRKFRQHWPMVLAVSAMLLLFPGGGADYAVVSSRSPDTVASQAAAGLAAATPVTAPAANEPAKSSARVVEEASRRKAALQPQAEEQRLADEAAARERLQREQVAEGSRGGGKPQRGPGGSRSSDDVP